MRGHRAIAGAAAGLAMTAAIVVGLAGMAAAEQPEPPPNKNMIQAPPPPPEGLVP
ncbi:MAG: hypothetical protein AAGA93_09055 [Actinomycetota bacterium]